MKKRNSLLCLILKKPENKKDTKTKRILFQIQQIIHWITFIALQIIQLCLYIISTPLRFINALYYDFFVHCYSQFLDSWAEIIHPKKSMKEYSGILYFIVSIIQLPYRLLYYGIIRGVLITFEGIFFVLFDTFYPTLTMYHGTSKDAGFKITVPGDFKVGNGNYAGSGIYFGSTIDTALHYSEAFVIITRVSLGRTINLNLSPSRIRNYVKNNGNIITRWGLKSNYTTAEWWRNDGWWEYCLLQEDGIYRNPWRIRPLYILDLYSQSRKRVYGGMNYWLYREENFNNCKHKYKD